MRTSARACALIVALLGAFASSPTIASAQCPDPTGLTAMEIEMACDMVGLPVIVGTTGDDTLNGTSAAECIIADAGMDTVTGQGGADCIYGMDGDDSLNGNGGDDTIWGGDGEDLINGSTGVDTIFGEGDADTIFGGGSGDTLNGGDGADTIEGDAGDDTINGGPGEDQLFGETGDDIINGDDDADTIEGGPDNDTIDGGGGADDITGNGGNDIINGGDGDDTRLEGSTGNDEINGGPGADTISGGSGDDTLNGDDGNDDISGSTGEDIIDGGDGEDTIDGGDDDDTIDGGLGSDPQLNGGEGNDTINGGPGDDTIDGQQDDDTLNGDAGNDTINGSTGSDTISGGADNDVIIGDDGDDELSGDGGADDISGGPGMDDIDGGDGDDTISGGDDADMIDGGEGADTIDGDLGDDTINGGPGNDPQLNGSEGNDTINGGPGDDTIDGEQDDDILNGGPGEDTIDGDTGNDTISGGDDNDLIDGFSGDDQIEGNGGADTITGSTGFDQIDGGDGDDIIDGGDDDDIIHGGPGADTIGGGAGNDTVWGGLGADELDGDEDADKVHGHCEDRQVGEPTGGWLYPDGTGVVPTCATIGADDDADDILRGSTGADRLEGGGGDDTLTGDSGNDVLEGGCGDDDLRGSPGADVLIGGTIDYATDPTTYTACGTDMFSDGGGFDFCHPVDCMERLTYARIGSASLVDVPGGAAFSFVTTVEVGASVFVVEQAGIAGFDRVAVVPATQVAHGARYFVRHDGVGGRYRVYEIRTDGARVLAGEFDVGTRTTAAFDVALHDGVGAIPRATTRTRVASRKANDAPDGEPVGVYLGVREDGVHEVPASVIAERLGLDERDILARLVSGAFVLTEGGDEIAWWSSADGAGLRFFGQSVESPFTRDRVYRLAPGAPGQGLRAETRSVTPSGGGDGVFVETVRVEEDVTAVTAIELDPRMDFWFWKPLGTSGVFASAEFVVPARAPVAGTATLEVMVAGAATRSTPGEHVVEVWLGGQQAGVYAFQDIGRERVRVSFDASLLVDGDNTVTLRGVGAAHSAMWVDHLALSYPRRAVDAGDGLVLDTGAGATVIEGLDADDAADVGLVDVTDPARPVRLTGADVRVGLDGYALGFEAAERRYVAYVRSAATAPRAWTDYASALRSEDNAYDYVVIAPRSLRSGAEQLAAYRRAQGHQAVVVDITDVYDEFAHGVPDPAAVRSFMQYAWDRWARPPRYLVLAGAGTYDYLDIGEHGGNLLPPMMALTESGLFASDNLLGDVDGDGVPEVHVGRLPVTTDTGLAALVARVEAYEAGLAAQSSGALMLSGGEESFAQDTESLLGALSGVETTRVDRLAFDADAAAASRNEALEGGVFWANYFGHGSLDGSAEAGLLGRDVLEVPARELPIYSMMTCTAGRFAVPGYESFAESAVTAEGGAIAVWAASGLSEGDSAEALAIAFGRALVDGSAMTLGEAVAAGYEALAQRRGNDMSTLRVYAVMGDPALRLKDRAEMAGPPMVVEDMGASGADAGATSSAAVPGGTAGGGGCTASAPADTGGLWLIAIGLVLAVRRRRA